MKAMIWTAYGTADVLQMREIDKPIPKDNELLVWVLASTVTAGDCELRRFDLAALTLIWLPMRLYTGLFKPRRIRILGQEVAGVVEAVGKNVTAFRVGDAVFTTTGFRLGGNAEYTCIAETGKVGHMPANLTFEEAAAVPLGGLEAWHYLQQADIQPGQSVLINGAGGSIGTIAVQLARHFGAEVTAVDSVGKLAMLQEIGADRVIDYQEVDFTAGGRKYDLIFDVVGSKSAGQCEESLKPGGRYLSANPGPSALLRGIWTFITRRRHVVAAYTRRRREDLAHLEAVYQKTG